MVFLLKIQVFWDGTLCQSQAVRDWGLRSSGILHSVDW
jgi:hypothetical protein